MHGDHIMQAGIKYSPEVRGPEVWAKKQRKKKKREKNRPAPADCSYKVLETEHFEDICWCAWHSSYITVMTLPGVEVPHLGYKQRGDKKVVQKIK